ncbi:hypothetical protein JRO89_XS05G0053700 [Xanthoceras sorbifolium]|uniref:RING-type E3 ubiquitin transferase n=1 Tax=Xanthoceras sorbifolium TaxID=99658 RepID=A0ABQ8I0H9_9ROSI|nr:hypothetical protein JRO89_XS05G0053700 [Xanthoceras sorbifolium]
MTSHLGPNHLSVRVSLVDHLYSSQASSDSDNLSTFEIDEEHIDATIEAIISLGRQIIDRNRSESNTSSKLLTGRVPASESSVKTLLKRVRVEEAAATGDGKKQESNKKLVSDDESQMNCSIRMEQLWAGTYATAMPCLHVYHGDCIVQWLKQSHFCPLCRYEMPTDN